MKEISSSKEIYLKDLKASRIFNMLKEEELKEILDSGKILEFEKDEIIIKEDEVDPNMYIIIKGAVSIIIKQKLDDDSIKDVYITTIGEGDIIGEAAIFLNVKRTAHAVSLMNLTVLKLERKEFIEFINNRPSAGIKILMLIIFSLLNKLKDVNHELAFERKATFDQSDIDSLMNEFIEKKES
jgi:CRP/FNR family transcriptional regulator, cyclic AMP receptor protein